jgi:hypothetical protein
MYIETPIRSLDLYVFAECGNVPIRTRLTVHNNPKLVFRVFFASFAISSPAFNKSLSKLKYQG